MCSERKFSPPFYSQNKQINYTTIKVCIYFYVKASKNILSHIPRGHNNMIWECTKHDLPCETIEYTRMRFRDKLYLLFMWYLKETVINNISTMFLNSNRNINIKEPLPKLESFYKQKMFNGLPVVLCIYWKL